MKILIREIDESFNSFLDKNKLNKKGKIFLSGRNSQHENLVEILGKSLKMDVSVISPINNYFLKEFSYNPDEINHFSMSRIVGLGLSLIKTNELEDQNFNSEFIVKSFSLKDNRENLGNEIKSTTKSIQEEIKDNAETKTKIEEKKKELPPLPNKGKAYSGNIYKDSVDKEKFKEEKDNPESKNKKSFKMDTSFLKDD